MYSPKEVGKMLGVTNVTILKLIHMGKIKAILVNKSYKITQEEVDKLLKYGTS